MIEVVQRQGARHTDDIDGQRITDRRRFVLERMEYKEAPAIVPPGELRTFVVRPQIPFAPEEMAIVAASAEGERLPRSCPVRLREMRLSDHVIDFGTEAFGPKIDLKPKKMREVMVAEDLACVVENTSKEPVLVKIAHAGRPRGSQGMYHLGTAPTHISKSRRFVIPPGQGAVDLIWRARTACRITRIWMKSDSQCDVDLVDIKVGNRSQLANSTSIPIEAYQDGMEVSLDPLRVQMDLAFVMENTSQVERHIEFEVEADVADYDALLPPGEPSHFDMREYPLGLYIASLPAGEHVDIVSRPQLYFLAQRLIVPSSLAEDVEIEHVIVNGKKHYLPWSQLATSYTEKNHGTFGSSLGELPTAQPCSDVIVRVFNRGKEPKKHFSMAMIGLAYNVDPETKPEPITDEVIARATEIIRTTPQFQGLARQLARDLKRAG